MHDRLTEIKARCEAATPGPWAYGGNSHRAAEVVKEHQVQGGIRIEFIADCYRSVERGGRNRVSDAEFIAHAREDIPFLLAEVDRLSDKLKMALLDLENACACDSCSRVEQCEYDCDGMPTENGQSFECYEWRGEDPECK